LEKQQSNFPSEIGAVWCLEVLQVIWPPNPSGAVIDEPRRSLGWPQSWWLIAASQFQGLPPRLREVRRTLGSLHCMPNTQ